MNNEVIDVIIKQKHENKLSHAYLIEINDYEKMEEYINNILKTLLCQCSDSHCDSCQECEYVDNYTHPNIERIKPDGSHIKINQIEELRKKFAGTSIYGKYNIYVIYEAEKLNTTSSNALLKFLEEPEDNIIGILLTKNKSLLLPTIISRCQNYIKNFEENEYSEKTVDLAKKIESLSSDPNAILVYQDIIENLEDKNEIKLAFSYLLKNEVQKAEDINKILILQDIVDKIRYNVNVDLFLLSYLLRMGRAYE